MEFLSAMFKGIGDTFTAGANVNIAQISERNTKRELAFQTQALASQREGDKLSYLLQTNQQEMRTLAIAVGAIVLLLIVLVIIRRMNK